MEVSDQFKAPAVFPSRNKPRYSHSIGLGPQTGLDVVAANKKKICLRRESNSGRRTRIQLLYCLTCPWLVARLCLISSGPGLDNCFSQLIFVASLALFCGPHILVHVKLLNVELTFHFYTKLTEN